MSTESQINANRANAKKSTGPRTKDGSRTSRFNAIKHNLTGRTILLPNDDADLYKTHCQAFMDDFKPLGVREQLLVQTIADNHWRLARIPALEAALYAVERHRNPIPNDPKIVADSLEIDTYLRREKELRNLHIQESRLTRYVKNAMAELKELQQARHHEEKQQYELAAVLAAEAKAAGQSFRPEEFGFVFSSADLQAFHDAKGNLTLAKKLAELRGKRSKTVKTAAKA